MEDLALGTAAITLTVERSVSESRVRQPSADGAVTVQDSRAAVEKACGLLSAFGADSRRVLGVSELARRTGLTKSTAHRQLNILARAEMVERSGNGYRIGRRLRALAHGVSDGTSSYLSDALLPYLVELFEITRYTVQLAVLDGGETVYIGKVYGHSSIPVPLRTGSRLPAQFTAGGKLLLAHHPHAADRVLTSPPHRLRPAQVGGHAELRRELDDIRRKGLAFDLGGSNADVSCVAAPITASDGAVLAAISLCASGESNLHAAAGVLGRIALAGSRHLRRPKSNVR